MNGERPRSSRGLLPGLGSPQPIGMLLPALYQEDGFAQRLTAALDEVMAPVFATLDNLEACFDPMLPRSTSWSGFGLGRRRAGRGVAAASQAGARLGDGEALRSTWHGRRVEGAGAHLHRRRARDHGQRRDRVVAGARRELPGSEDSFLVVRASTSEAQARRLDAIVAGAKPAHVPHRVLLTGE
jgi:hypothetical protein